MLNFYLRKSLKHLKEDAKMLRDGVALVRLPERELALPVERLKLAELLDVADSGSSPQKSGCRSVSLQNE